MNVSYISCGTNHNAVVTEQGHVLCWGLSRDGQCGVTEKGVFVPSQIVFTDNSDAPDYGAKIVDITSVACGASHTIALSSDGELWVWGKGHGMGLGQSSEVSRPVMLEALYGRNIMSVACGEDFTIALLERSVLGEVKMPRHRTSSSDMKVNKDTPRTCKLCNEEVYTYSDDKDDTCVITNEHHCKRPSVTSAPQATGAVNDSNDCLGTSSTSTVQSDVNETKSIEIREESKNDSAALGPTESAIGKFYKDSEAEIHEQDHDMKRSDRLDKDSEAEIHEQVEDMKSSESLETEAGESQNQMKTESDRNKRKCEDEISEIEKETSEKSYEAEDEIKKDLHTEACIDQVEISTHESEKEDLFDENQAKITETIIAPDEKNKLCDSDGISNSQSEHGECSIAGDSSTVVSHGSGELTLREKPTKSESDICDTSNLDSVLTVNPTSSLSSTHKPENTSSDTSQLSLSKSISFINESEAREFLVKQYEEKDLEEDRIQAQTRTGFDSFWSALPSASPSNVLQHVSTVQQHVSSMTSKAYASVASAAETSYASVADKFTSLQGSRSREVSTSELGEVQESDNKEETSSSKENMSETDDVFSEHKLSNISLNSNPELSSPFGNSDDSFLEKINENIPMPNNRMSIGEGSPLKKKNSWSTQKQSRLSFAASSG